MNLRWIGAAMVVVSCSSIGFLRACNYRKTINHFAQFLSALTFMQNELSYRMTALPELMVRTSKTVTGCVSDVFLDLGKELERQVSPDATCCMEIVLKRNKRIPEAMAGLFHRLGVSLGAFDLEGQLSQLDEVKQMCARQYEQLNQQKGDRIRQYQTLGICVGVILAVLLI